MSSGSLRIQVIAGRGLKSPRVSGSIQPFVLVLLSGSRGEEVKKTMIDFKGGANPHWQSCGQERFLITIDESCKMMTLKAMDSVDEEEPKLIGSCVIELRPLLERGKTDEWFQIRSANNQETGSIHLVVHFEAFHDSSGSGSLYPAIPELSSQPVTLPISRVQSAPGGLSSQYPMQPGGPPFPANPPLYLQQQQQQPRMMPLQQRPPPPIQQQPLPQPTLQRPQLPPQQQQPPRSMPQQNPPPYPAAAASYYPPPANPGAANPASPPINANPPPFAPPPYIPPFAALPFPAPPQGKPNSNGNIPTAAPDMNKRTPSAGLSPPIQPSAPPLAPPPPYAPPPYGNGGGAGGSGAEKKLPPPPYNPSLLANVPNGVPNNGLPAQPLAKSEYEIMPGEITSMGACLGQGSFGAVYRARFNGAVVAVKQPYAQHPNPQEMEDLRHEVEILVRMRHPNCVAFYGACLIPGKIAIVTELLSRGSLFDVLAKPEKPGAEVRLRMARDCAAGVLHLHRRGIVHRDLKSLNMLVGEDYTVKVADYGLAMLKDKAKMHSDGRSGKGTPCWMAPELFKMERATEASDVYALGIIFWEILTCQGPFKGVDVSVVTQFVTTGGRPQLPDRMPAGFPEEYVHMMCSCWQQQPSQRAPLSDVLACLERLCEAASGHSL